MKYFIDTEFLEGPQNQYLFGFKTPIVGPNTIDLISIGIVAEDGREYYAISKDLNLEEAWNRFDLKTMTNLRGDSDTNKMKVYWIRENVLKPIYKEFNNKEKADWMKAERMGIYYDFPKYNFTFKKIKSLLVKYGKTNKEIAEEIVKFCNDEVFISKVDGKLVASADFVRGNPEFYAYYADYDWVVFCWLFGKMMDLPSGFPMYCKDLKQILDDKAKLVPVAYDVEHGVKAIKLSLGFPKQDPSKSHNAIEDARWNKLLYDFLCKI